MKRLAFITVLVLAVVLLSACAPGPNEMADIPKTDGKVAGFWTGLWHGFASPVIFVVSLFNSSVEVYEVHNNGGWYSLGFLLGASAVFGGSGSGACSRKRRNRRDA